MTSYEGIREALRQAKSKANVKFGLILDGTYSYNNSGLDEIIELVQALTILEEQGPEVFKQYDLPFDPD